jgi:hypothetical protein
LSVLFGFMVTLGSANIVNQIMSGMVLVYSRRSGAATWLISAARSAQ